MVLILIFHLAKLSYMIIFHAYKKRRTLEALRFISFYLIKIHAYQRSFLILL